MKLLFADEKFEDSEMKNRAQRLLEHVQFTIQKAWPDAQGFLRLSDPTGWAQAAVKLKQTLLMSPNDYRIHYCRPGSRFDPAWMVAEDAEGDAVPDAQSKRVATCFFPALVEQKPSPFAEQPALTNILVGNKTFFPTFAEKQSLDPKRVISKAIVLVI